MPIGLILLFFLTLLTYFFSLRSQQCTDEAMRQRLRVRYIYAYILVLILVAGLRNVAVGPDTYAYMRTFYQTAEARTLHDVWHNVVLHYTSPLPDAGGKDPGYYCLAKLFSMVLPSYRLWMIFVVSVFYLGAAYIIKSTTRTISQAFVALLIFQVLFLIYSFTALRQDLALGLAMFSYRFVRERRLVCFVALVLLASMLHRSALLFLPYYFVAPMRRVRLMVVGLCLALPFMYGYARAIAAWLADSSAAGTYASYLTSTYEGTGTPTFTALLLICFGFYVYMLGRLNRHLPDHQFFTNSLFFTMALSPLTWVDPSLMRTMLYFSCFLPVIMSRCISMAPTLATRKQLVVAVAVAGYFLVLYSQPPYDFFWNNMPLPGNYGFTVDTTWL